MTVRAMTSPYTAVLGVVLGTWCFMGGCSWIPKGDSQFDVGIKDRGTASWYGEPFHGKQAADGTIYDMEGLTAAHRTMPLGSMVRVVNLVNGKYIYVRITDRGPYVNGRILDLSHAAAIRLGMEKGDYRWFKLKSSESVDRTRSCLLTPPRRGRLPGFWAPTRRRSRRVSRWGLPTVHAPAICGPGEETCGSRRHWRQTIRRMSNLPRSFSTNLFPGSCAPVDST